MTNDPKAVGLAYIEGCSRKDFDRTGEHGDGRGQTRAKNRRFTAPVLAVVPGYAGGRRSDRRG